MNNKINPHKKQAQLAGGYYLLHILISIYGMIYVGSSINLQGDAAGIFSQLNSNESLFRSGILCRMLSSVPWVLLAITLYQLLKQVNVAHAKMMMAWMLLPVPICFIAEALNITAMANAHSIPQVLQTWFISKTWLRYYCKPVITSFPFRKYFGDFGYYHLAC